MSGVDEVLVFGQVYIWVRITKNFNKFHLCCSTDTMPCQCLRAVYMCRSGRIIKVSKLYNIYTCANIISVLVGISTNRRRKSDDDYDDDFDDDDDDDFDDDDESDDNLIPQFKSSNAALSFSIKLLKLLHNSSLSQSFPNIVCFNEFKH